MRDMGARYTEGALHPAGYAEQEKTPHAIVKMDGMGRKFVSGAGVFWAPGPFDRVHSTGSFSATKSRKRLAAE